MASYSSDQLVAHATGDGQLVPATQRARITSIQEFYLIQEFI